MPPSDSRNSFTANGGLATVTLASLDHEDTTCSICLTSYHCAPNFEDPRRLPCGHVLGGVCILTWMAVGNACPMCRFELFALSIDVADEADESIGGYGSANLHAVEPVSLDVGFWNGEDGWEGRWLRSLGVHSAYIPLGSEDDPLGPVSVFRSEADFASLDLSFNVLHISLGGTGHCGEDIHQCFPGSYMTMGLTDVFTPALVTQNLIVGETEVEYGSG